MKVKIKKDLLIAGLYAIIAKEQTQIANLEAADASESWRKPFAEYLRSLAIRVEEFGIEREDLHSALASTRVTEMYHDHKREVRHSKNIISGCQNTLANLESAEADAYSIDVDNAAWAGVIRAAKDAESKSGKS